MTFSESGLNVETPTDVNREGEERETALQATTAERANLSGQIEDEVLWNEIPDVAKQYLEAECDAKQIPRAISYLRSTKAKEFGGMDNIPEAFWPMVLDSCIQYAEEKSEIAARTTRVEDKTSDNTTKKAVLETEKATGQQLDTTIEVLSNEKKALIEINEQSETRELHGRAQIDFALSFLEDPDIPKEVKDKLGARFGQIAATLDEMTNVFANDPIKQEKFEQIVSGVNFDLGAGTLGETFAPIMAQVEASGTFAESDKQRLRLIVTGSQAQDTLGETMLDENGKVVPAWPEDNPLPIRPGVTMYADVNQRQYLQAEYNGHITKIDMTGLRGETVGKYLEALSFVQEIESFGGTGILQSIYKIDFNVFGEEGFDMLKIDQILNFMDKIVGGMESSDGDIAREGQRKGMIRFLVRLLNKDGTAYGFEESQANTNEVIKELELHNADGTPNWKQLDKLGQFVQTNYLSGDASYKDLREFLIGSDA